jgi:ribosomal protein S18 acetylase RimI-like enzyme
MDIVITPVTRTTVGSLIALARQVWQCTYSGIISQEQIDYMLGQRYSPQRLFEELAMPGVWWDQATIDGRLAGFSSCLLAPAGSEMKLDKLYVDPQRQRMGIGGRLIARVEEHARASGCRTLILAVNKRNERAIAAYRKQGFAVRESVCVDIGQGFVMDDFIMARSLRAPAAQS